MEKRYTKKSDSYDRTFVARYQRVTRAHLSTNIRLN